MTIPAVPTIPEIRDQILADIQSGLGITTPLLPRSVWRVLATAQAGALYLGYLFARWAYAQIFTATCDEDALINRGAEYGLVRTPPVEWRGTATATGTTGTTIPAGTLWTLDGAVYQQESAVDIAAGTATITLFALEPGESGNLDAATELDLSSPIAGVDRIATVATTTQPGVDEEPLENFRDRLAARQAAQPQGGAKPDYVQWALEVPGIAEAFPHSPTPGVVNVYPITSEPDPADRIPDAPLLATVTAYLNEDVRRPLGPVTIEAIEFDEIEFDVDIADLSPNTAAMKAAIEAAIEDYLYARRPKLYDDEPSPRDVISAARITRVCIDSGAEVVTVDLKNAGGSSITSYTLEAYELAKLRTLTWI